MNNSSACDVVIYGGGIAGAVLARQLSRLTKVGLVDPLDYFEVPMAAPRNLVKPEFAKQAIIPFAKALPDVEHKIGRLTELSPAGGMVEQPDGSQVLVSPKITVLATGNSFANELMRGKAGGAVDRQTFYQRFHQRLAGTKRILLIGGGPIGVEVAGEIIETWPQKHVTLVESGPRLLAGSSEGVSARAGGFLKGKGARILTGQRIESLPGSPQEVFAEGGSVRTTAGNLVEYDLAIWCIGGRPNTAYMKQHFADVLTPEGRIMVASDLRVKGDTSIFAIGDITDLAENKMAYHIKRQVKVAAANIRAMLAGGQPSASYTARTGDPTMLVTLGSRAGVAHLPLIGDTCWSWLIRKAKAENMLVPKYIKAISR